MMQILGGKRLNNLFSYRVKANLLWPAYEFIVPVEGYSDDNQNILENTILKLMEINIITDKEISDATGLETDLISFIQSRLFQKGYIDETYKITDEGLKYIGELSEKKNSTFIYVYVDAITGNVIPYTRALNNDEDLQYTIDVRKDYDENKNFTGFYRFRQSESIGEDSDDELKAWQLNGNNDFNGEPRSDDINDMLAKTNPGNDVFIRHGSFEQNLNRNFVNFMVEIFLPEGASGIDDWIISDGFGNISTYFSSQISHFKESDFEYINSLRKPLDNVFLGEEKSIKKQNSKYKELIDKIDNVQREMTTINQSVNSPDAEIIYISAKNDAILYITQMLEWTFFYTLHNYKYETDTVLAELSKLAKNRSSHYIIGNRVFRILSELKIETDTMTKNRLTESYKRLVSSYNSIPSLFPLFDLIILVLRDEPFFKEFISKNRDFVLFLQKLVNLRNTSFHTGDDIIRKTEIEPLYSLALKVVESFLNLIIEKVDGKKSFYEEVTEKNQRDAAILRVEKNFGFLICNTLDKNIIRFFIDMEKRINSEGKIVNNAIILDLYKIYETIFKSINLSLSNESKASDWLGKARSVGLSLDTKKIGAVEHASIEKINKALERKPSSMQASCVAFIMLSDIDLLREISIQWNTFIEDIAYIAHARGHGEIPSVIDDVSVNKICKLSYAFIKMLISKGFLINRDI